MNKILHCLLLVIFTSLLPANEGGTFVRSAVAADNETDSREENAPKSRVFSVHDTNRDGTLDRDEYSKLVDKLDRRRKANKGAKHRPLSPASFDEIDADGDDHISEDELVNSLNKRLRNHRRYRSHGFSS